MIRAGLLGLGAVGRVHLAAYEMAKTNKDEISLNACFDLSEESLKGADCERKYTDLDQFFENEKGKLDFVDICLPTFMHREVAVKAMKYGFHVLCEKPMALNSEDSVAIYEASKETGKHLMIAQVLRFSYLFNVLRDYIDNGILGKIKNVKYTNFYSGLPSGHNNWLLDVNRSGGAVLDFHVHDTDLIMWLFGKPKTISAVGNRETFSANYLYDDFYLNFQCDFTVKGNKHDEGRAIRINFENGYIIMDGSRFIMVDSEGNEKDLAEDQTRGEAYDDPMYYNEIKYFSTTVQNSIPVDACLPEETLYSIKFIEAELESAYHNGKTIEIL